MSPLLNYHGPPTLAQITRKAPLQLCSSPACKPHPNVPQLVVLGIPYTPWKINMEHNHGGLEDDIPFQMGDL